MELFKNRLFHYLLAVTGLVTLIILLAMLEERKVVTDAEVGIVEEVIKDAVEIQLRYIDGRYQVDNDRQKFYLDLT